MSKQYVEVYDGGYWIVGKRISLDSVIYAFRRGAAPESMQRSFPLLSLEEIYGAIAFYLANEKKIDDYLISEEQKFEVVRDASMSADTKWFEKMQRARNELLASHS